MSAVQAADGIRGSSKSAAIPATRFGSDVRCVAHHASNVVFRHTVAATVSSSRFRERSVRTMNASADSSNGLSVFDGIDSASTPKVVDNRAISLFHSSGSKCAPLYDDLGLLIRDLLSRAEGHLAILTPHRRHTVDAAPDARAGSTSARFGA